MRIFKVKILGISFDRLSIVDKMHKIEAKAENNLNNIISLLIYILKPKT